jgi:hypothetical protein
MKKGKKGLLIVTFILAVIMLLPVATGYISADNPNAVILGLEGMAFGYYVSLLGVLAYLVGSAWMIKDMKKGAKKPAMPEATPQTSTPPAQN